MGEVSTPLIAPECARARSSLLHIEQVTRRFTSFCLDERISQVVLFLDKPEHHRSQYLKLVQPIDAAHPDKVANRRILERRPFEVRPSYLGHAEIHDVTRACGQQSTLTSFPHQAS